MIRAAIVGVGWWGRTLVESVQGASDKLRFVTAATRTKTPEYEAFVKQHGLRTAPDFDAALGDKEVDAVVLSTPHSQHADQVIAAAKAGKHVFCEKPLTHTVAEGRRIVAEVAKAKVVFQTGSQQRSEFGGHFRKAVEYVWNGRVGSIRTIRIGVGGPPRPCDLPEQETPPGTDWNLWLGPAPLRPYHEVLCPKGVHNHFPAWRNYQEYAGGGLADMGAHHFDIAQWALGMDASGPVEILPPENRQQESGLRMIYANGVTLIHNEFEGDARADCVFEGSGGLLLVGRGGISSRPESILQEPLPDDARRVEPSSNHHQNWLDAIRQGRSCICPAEVGHRSATVCHLANIGYRLRRRLRWNPATEAFADDAEANALRAREPREPWRIT